MRQVLSPKELAEAIGVSESSLKRWADEGLLRASRTAGGHRRIPLAEAIRFVRDTRATLVRPEILDLPDVEAVAGDLPALQDAADRLFELLRDGHDRAARGLVMSLYLGGETTAWICDGPVREAMSRIGELWLHDPQGVYLEHRATDICIQALNRLRLTFPEEPGAPVAIGGAPPGDPYVLPSLIAATVLAAEGFRSVNLGPDTPAEALAQAVRDQNARLAWLTISNIGDPDATAGDVSKLAGQLADIGLSLVIGGRVVDELKLPRHGNLHVGRSMSELAAFAKGLTLAPQPDVVQRSRQHGAPSSN
ncbi:MAG: MerR family DNA-binding transcriptional regulator [Phycisphaerales bacterium]|nr:MAG: MerR family DNA-binding transcriptional regulator [Phycisphaerales bacterium]